MPRPPECVALVARHHWLTSGAMLFFIGLLWIFTRDWYAFEISRKGYAITLAIAVFYGGVGAMVWFGVRVGRYLNYVCSLIYLARPALGLRLWKAMGTPEFKNHFDRKEAERN
jgi:hypothetical protein